MSVAIASSLKPTIDKKKKSKSKDKEKFKSAEYIEDVDDEADSGGPSGSTSTGYTPPGGMVLHTEYLDTTDFDYDELKDNDDLELWIIKAPHDIKPKHLNNLKISIPSSSASSQIGSLSRKSTNYDIWSVKEKSQASVSQSIVGGDDLLGLTCLVPRKKKRHLIMAPKPFEHHIVITGNAALPTPPASSPEAPEPTFLQDSGRYQHPAHLLKHRFLPIGLPDAIGSKPASGGDDTAMAVDGKDAVPPSSPPKSPKKSQDKEKTKEKKRKDGDTTEPSKKSKKSKNMAS